MIFIRYFHEKYDMEEVNELVQNGTPFRDAYKIVGGNIAKGDFKPNKGIKHTHLGSVGNLALKEIQSKMEVAIVK